MRGFSLFNKILISLYDASNTFHYNILVFLHCLTYVRYNVS